MCQDINTHQMIDTNHPSSHMCYLLPKLLQFILLRFRHQRLKKRFANRESGEHQVADAPPYT